jgi:hypothetical protein
LNRWRGGFSSLQDRVNTSLSAASARGRGGKSPIHFLNAQAKVKDLSTSPAARIARSRGDTKKATTNTQTGHLQDGCLTKALAIPAFFYARLFSMFISKKARGALFTGILSY